MKKFLPLLAVLAITSALIAVAVTRGLGGFSTAQSSGTCTGTIRQVAECVKTTCGSPDQSPEYRECVQRAKGTNVRPDSTNTLNRDRPAAPQQRQKPHQQRQQRRAIMP